MSLDTSSNEFDGQNVIITGGTRGIGAGMTKAFLKKGARVVATYARNDEAAEKFKAELGELSENLDLRKFDVSKKEEVDTFFSYFQENYLSLEVLINNSGIRKDGLVPSMSEENWDSVLNINLKGSFLMAQGATLLMMRKRYGRIINMSSVGGSLGLPGQSNYAASKAGQVAMSKCLAKEVGKRNITVNNICPGFIETELIGDLPEEQVKEYKAQVPLKRFGTVEEVAHAALFLASKDAGYITGAVLEITGGL
jgi:3-oxoacyl-[acyl-carrier protein] reductase